MSIFKLILNFFLHFLASPNEATKMAEKLGLGFIDHGRFVKKQNVAIEARLSSLPRIREKVLDGKISHVSVLAHLVHWTQLI